MGDLFTTEDVLLFISETIERSENFLNIDHETFHRPKNSYSLFEENFVNFQHPRFGAIPFWINFSIRGALWCITIVLNVLVIRYYSKEKGSTRSNILALSYVDVIFAALSFFASLIQLFFVNSLVYNVIDVIQFSIENVILSNYLYPSLFLAVDRFIAVAFPHKVKDLLNKVRPIKWVVFVLNVLVVSVMISMKFVSFRGSKVVDSVLSLARFLLLCVQLFGTSALYTTIVVLLIRSNKTLGKATHG